MNRLGGSHQKSDLKWVVVGVTVLLIASVIAVSGGALKNQTTVSVRNGKGEFSNLVPLNPASSVSVDMNPEQWKVTSSNAVLSSSNGGLQVTASNVSTSSFVLVTETVGLSLNSSSLPYLHLDFTCPLGVQFVLALGWAGLNTTTGPAAVAVLSSHPGLLAGIETKYGVVWFNAGYPSSGVQCSGREENLVINMKQELSQYGLTNPGVGGVQLKAILPRPTSKGIVLQAYSITVDDSPSSYVAMRTDGIQAHLISDGSAVVITSPTNMPAEGYYPKRISISYELFAPAGTTYSIFVVTKYNGTTYIFNSYQAFSHSNASLGIGTTVDFVNGEVVIGTLEPLASLSSVLAEGQIAVLFVPFGQSTFESVQVESLQTSWGLLPFGSSGFIDPASGPGTTMAVGYMFALATVIPVLVSAIIWFRFRKSLSGPSNVVMVLIGAAAIRFALAPVTGSIDTDNFATTASVYFSSGAFGADWVNLPGFLYAEIFSYFPYAILRNFGFMDSAVFSHSTYALETVFVKLPSILADLGLGLILSNLAARFRPDLKGQVLVLYLFNPLTVYLSGVYGQYDDLFLFLLISSLYAFFLLHKPLLTGVLLGATGLVNPVGLAAWLPILAFSAKTGEVRRSLKVSLGGVVTISLGLVPLLLQPSSVFQATFERFVSAIPGDPVVGTILQFVSFGETHLSSVGYGLSFRMLLELAGSSLGFYFYPLAAGVAFLALTAFLFAKVRTNESPGVLTTVAFLLGVVSLFDFFFPTVYLQFALWPFVLLLVLHVITGEERYMSLAFLVSFVSGVLYVGLVDKPFDRAAGLSGGFILDLQAVNSVWAMVGLVFSILMAYIAILSIRAMKGSRQG